MSKKYLLVISRQDAMCTKFSTHSTGLVVQTYLSGVPDVPLKVHVRVDICPMLKGQYLHALYVSSVHVSNRHQNKYKYKPTVQKSTRLRCLRGVSYARARYELVSPNDGVHHKS
jgi:hypothetical protein